MSVPPIWPLLSRAAAGGRQDVLEFLVEHGFAGMAQAMQTLLNEAMKLERATVLEAEPYEPTPQRRGYPIHPSILPTVRYHGCGARRSQFPPHNSPPGIV
jgi:hypothetical protein